MSVRENLTAAIREYVQIARNNPDSRGIVEQLQGLEREVAQAPDPQPQGEGVISNPNGHGPAGDAGHSSGEAKVQINIGGDALRRSHAVSALKAANGA